MIAESYLVACKSVWFRERWYASVDAVDSDIGARLRGSEDGGTSLLKNYDGATQRSYQFPPKPWEAVYCRREPQPFECAFAGLDLTKQTHDLGDNSSSSSSSSFVLNGSGEGSDDNDGMSGIVYYDSSEQKDRRG